MMSETTVDDVSPSSPMSAPASRPPLMRASTLPAKATSLLAKNPWYQQKFDQYRDVIEEKVREKYPDLPKTFKPQATNIEHSKVNGYDLDFPIELHDGEITIVSLSYGSGQQPAYTKEERAKRVTVRQKGTDKD